MAKGSVQIKFNTKGFDNMVRQLRRYNAGSTKKIIDRFTQELLAKTAKGTKVGDAKKIAKNVASIYKRPFEVKGQGKVGVTANGKVWVNLNSWGSNRRWALLNEDGKLNQAPSLSIRTGRDRPGKKVNLGDKNKAAINNMMAVAKAFKKKETEYRKATRGLSKATWYSMLRALNFRLPTDAPAYALKISSNMPANARAAISVSKQLKNPNDYKISISNKVQSCLNPTSKGISAFAFAFNQKIKGVETAMKIDAKKYALQFAQRHGFTVR